MQNTVPKLTHHQQKTNFFPYSKRDVAGSGLLEKLKFVQWRISETVQAKTENVNVIRLAALLAALPRMGIIAFNFSHNHMSKKFAELYGVSAPSRKSILNWEHALQDLGYIKIPKHNASKSKTRVFTDEFWNLSRVGPPSLSHTSVPVTWFPTNGDKQAIPKDPTVTRNLETEKRAIDIDNSKEQRQSRAPSQDKKFSRPPKFDGKRPKKLSRFENSIMFWLFQNRELQTYREGVILFAQFLEMASAGDDYCRKLQQNWKDCRDASRPGLVRDLIRFLRSSVEFSARGGDSNANPVPPLQILDPSPNETRKQSPEIQKLLNTILWQAPYSGDCPDVIEKFRNGDPDVQDRILDDLMKGIIPVKA